MTRYRFTILCDTSREVSKVPYEEREQDHDAVIQGFLRTFEKRAYVEESRIRAEGSLRSVFENILVQDAADPLGQKHLLIWDLLDPLGGPEAIDLLATSFNKYDYARSTQMRYLGDIRRLFDYILTKPYIPGRVPVAIAEKYDPPLQPVSQYDCPTHSVDDDNVEPAIVGDDLKRLLNFVRVEHINQNQKKHTAERNYAMIVLAATAGMRADELLNLDLDDLRYGENRVWIRFGKGCKGSGKRQRLTPFTRLAQATLRVYESQTRPLLGRPDPTSRALFLNESGNRITYAAMRSALLDIGESARKAGIELPTPFGWHDLRRSFATGYAEGRPNELLVLSRHLGHTGLGTLHRYIRPSRKATQKATESVLARFLSKLKKS